MKKTNSQQKIIDKICKYLKEIKFFINQDGGDVNFVGFEKGILTLEITGACIGCVHFTNTYDYGIKIALMSKIKEIKDVVFTIPKKTKWHIF